MSNGNKSSAVNRGFTLVELLVVIAIIGILVALLLPAVQSAREAARRASCTNNMHQLGVALHSYYSAFQEFPAGAHDGDCEGEPHERYPITWRIAILPYIEQQATFDILKPLAEQSRTRSCYPQRPWENTELQQQVMPAFICPSDQISRPMSGVATWAGPQIAAVASYFGNAGPVSTGPADWGRPKSCGLCINDISCRCDYGNDNGPGNRGFYHGHNPRGPGVLDMWPSGRKMSQIPDGTSNTILLGETHWSDPGSGEPGCSDQMAWMSSWCVASSVWGINTDYLAQFPSGDIENWQAGCNWRSRHVGGANFCMADGSVDFFTDDIDLWALSNLSERNDGRTGNQPRPRQSGGGSR